ncbi:hypothetical protein ACWC9H_01580 [Streptomyces sp. NPDC001251]
MNILSPPASPPAPDAIGTPSPPAASHSMRGSMNILSQPASHPAPGGMGILSPSGD